jgi:hypothetical protein
LRLLIAWMDLTIKDDGVPERTMEREGDR